MNTRNISNLKKQKSNQIRRGVTAVEFALTAPILFMFVFASVEFSNANMFRNSAENAAYEGARRAIIPGATVADAETAAQVILNAIGTQSATITVTPNPIDNSTPTVQVSINIPMDANGWITPVFFGDLNIQRSCTMNRETLD
jgi:Flp pilus assembly protein TadG